MGTTGVNLKNIETSLIFFAPSERAFSVVKDKLRFMYIYNSHAFNLFSPFQITVLGTGSDVQTINVFHLLIYVMVRMTVGTSPTKSLVGIEEKVSRSEIYYNYVIARQQLLQ